MVGGVEDEHAVVKAEADAAVVLRFDVNVHVVA